ncbi:MAG: alpha/beta fold hydrolase [Planctomycetaceae bacterium]|nr:alpha/beta fold hydrolase [Planctomycetaceae bacterium]
MSRLRCFPVFLAALLAAVDGRPGRTESPEERSEASAEEDETAFDWNLPIKTLGGRQFWGDVRFFHDWRIQRSVLDGHYRLLDGRDVRYASGTLEECERRLEEVRRERMLPPMSGKAVIFVHGIVRSSKSFAPMKDDLRAAGYSVFGFDYPSTRVEIPDAAEFLRQCIGSLDGITEINFVVHSMGGLVVRASLVPDRDPRIHRMVMLGVPNLGARMANLLQKNYLYRTFYGPAGQQLIEDPDGFIAHLPTPDFEFAVIAGVRGTPDGYNPLIPGDDDGTVSLAATRLPGAHDFLAVRVLHALLMRDPEVIAATERFLRTGALRESGDREPIPLPERLTQSPRPPLPPELPAPPRP